MQAQRDNLKRPYRYVRLCAWGGPVILAGSLIFWGVIPGNIPPYSAALDAETFAAHYAAASYAIRFGMVVMLALSTAYFMWGVAIAKVMEKVERDNDVLSRLQQGGALFTTIITGFPCWIWLTAAFRPETLDPEIVQLLYDMGWFLFVGAWSLTSLQMIAIGACFLGDDRAEPLLPRWASWFCIYAGFSFLVELALPFFKSGPFSRNGSVNFWLEFAIFFSFISLVSYYIFKAIPRLEREEAGVADHG